MINRDLLLRFDPRRQIIESEPRSEWVELRYLWRAEV